MVEKRRIGFGGLIMGVSVAAMFLVTDALDIGGYRAGKQADALALEDEESSCTSLRDAATGVMQARQAGAERDAVSEVLKSLGKDGELMLAIAYGYPVHDTLEEKDRVIMEFSEGIQSKCLSVAKSGN
jgi:hypothetical protein